MPVIVKNSTREPRLRRLYCPTRRKFLHLSGAGWVETTDYAWSGYSYNADNIMRKTPEAKDCLLLPLTHGYAPTSEQIGA